MAIPDPPTFTSNQYGAVLDSTEFWEPYALAALRRSGYSEEPLTSGFPGTYPTLMGANVAVKLFGHFGDWPKKFAAEVATNELIATSDDVRAPKVLATGRLFPGRDDAWPYLVMQRLPGTAWRDAHLDRSGQRKVARELGAQLQNLHDLDPRPAGLGQRDWLDRQRAGASERLRQWGSLPEHLLDQLDSYLAELPSGPSCLVHGDVTEDHVFVEDNRLVGLIDWGDALITDPYYDLGAVHFGTFGADLDLLSEFLIGYGLRVDDQFARHAMQVALLHEFDLMHAVMEHASAARTLDDLAHRLWRPK